MISIIICSRTKEVDSHLLRNIREHIGAVAYEVIAVDNSDHKYTIFQAYNWGVRQARYPILCFMHDDILFHSQDWGVRVAAHFEDERLGMLGISGPRFLSRIPSIWWASNAFNRYAPSVCQYSIDTERNTRVSVRQCVRPVEAERIEVAAVDGVFFCIRRALFGTIAFDEQVYDGFHCYDLDVSMQVRRAGYRIDAVYDVLLEHISASQLDAGWLRSLRSFYTKWAGQLPVLTYAVTARERACLERSNIRVMLDILADNGVSRFAFFTCREWLYLFRYCPKALWSSHFRK